MCSFEHLFSCTSSPPLSVTNLVALRIPEGEPGSAARHDQLLAVHPVGIDRGVGCGCGETADTGIANGRGLRARLRWRGPLVSEVSVAGGGGAEAVGSGVGASEEEQEGDEEGHHLRDGVCVCELLPTRVL